MMTSSKSRMTKKTYRGRFAPTPSGPLHLGSLFTALASWLDARSQQGIWLIRMDDLDAPRCMPGAADTILAQLDQHGLCWDEAPRYQSKHVGDYLAALAELQEQQLLYRCSCTRMELQAESLKGPDGPVYTGRCQLQPRHPERMTALRFRVPPGTLLLDDEWQGEQRREVLNEIGDFVLQRSDGIVGYQLACVIDEAAQGITQVIRGSDLLGSSFRQRLLQTALGYQVPHYCHLPVLGDGSGRKLSKQNHAPAITAAEAPQNLWHCLRLLNQDPPAALAHEAPSVILQWAAREWRPQNISKAPFIVVEE